MGNNEAKRIGHVWKKSGHWIGKTIEKSKRKKAGLRSVKKLPISQKVYFKTVFYKFLDYSLEVVF